MHLWWKKKHKIKYGNGECSICTIWRGVQKSYLVTDVHFWWYLIFIPMASIAVVFFLFILVWRRYTTQSDLWRPLHPTFRLTSVHSGLGREKRQSGCRCRELNLIRDHQYTEVYRIWVNEINYWHNPSTGQTL